MKPPAGFEWIYIFGEPDRTPHAAGPHPDLKIGKTRNTLRNRQAQLEADRRAANNRTAELVLLAAVLGKPTDEKALHDHFAAERLTGENFTGSQRLAEWINWLRGGWWTTLEIDDPQDCIEPYDRWAPAPDRLAPYTPDPVAEDQFFDPGKTLTGPLAGTAWNWLRTAALLVKGDYFTPTELVCAAREAMGGIDLDPASHYAANRLHRIPDFYDQNSNGLRPDVTWAGRVWMNPPYGNNRPWFEKLQRHYEAGDVEQACYLAPMWVFITALAHQTIMPYVKALLLLTPTPRFWGNPDLRTGRNDPHGIAYLGPRTAEFRTAFHGYGAPLRPDYDPDRPTFEPRRWEDLYPVTAERIGAMT
jgi:DNA N-6-adenine-methyltransferase (Dam)